MTTSRAWLVDLMHGLGEKTAELDHLEEKYLSSEDYRTPEIKQLMEKLLEARRKGEDLLLRNGKKGNPHFWCDFKHAIKSYTHDIEVFEANPCDQTLELAQMSADILAGTTSLVLGMDFEVCARCFNDMLLTKQLTESKHELGTNRRNAK